MDVCWTVAGMIGLFFMVVVLLLSIVDLIMCSVDSSNAVKKHSGGSSDAVDSDLTLRRAASRTVGAMPEWLKKQADHLTPDRWKLVMHDLEWKTGYKVDRNNPMPEEALRENSRYDDERLYDDVQLYYEWLDSPEWLKKQFDEEEYSVERAGLEYLDLMLKIGKGIDPGDEGYQGRAFPSLDYKLPSSLRDTVNEIVRFLKSLPDSTERPREDVAETVMETISSLATIQGKSFTAALRDAKAEELAKIREAENKRRNAYNDAILSAVSVAKSRMPDENDVARNILLHDIDKLDKLSRGDAAAEALHSQQSGEAAYQGVPGRGRNRSQLRGERVYTPSGCGIH